MPKISELDPGAALTGSEAFPGQLAAKTSRYSAAQMAAYVVASQAGLNPNNLVQLTSSATLPALDAHALFNINAANLVGQLPPGVGGGTTDASKLTGYIYLRGPLTALPATLGTGQTPAHLFDINGENLTAGSSGAIEGVVTRYIFGGSNVKGNRFAQVDWIANTIPTNNPFGQYCASLSMCYTNVGDGGIAGSPLGLWFAGNDVGMLDHGSGLYTKSLVGREVDLIVDSAAGADVIIGYNFVSAIARHANVHEAAISFSASTFNGSGGPIVGLPFNYLLLCTDFNANGSELPVGSNTTVFGSSWKAGLGVRKPLGSFADLSGFTGDPDGWIIFDFFTTIDWKGNIFCDKTLTCAAVDFHRGYTIATLPVLTGPEAVGFTTYVTNGAAGLTPGSPLGSTTGSTPYLVWYNGTAWTVIGK